MVSSNAPWHPIQPAAPLKRSSPTFTSTTEQSTGSVETIGSDDELSSLEEASSEELASSELEVSASLDDETASSEEEAVSSLELETAASDEVESSELVVTAEELVTVESLEVVAELGVFPGPPGVLEAVPSLDALPSLLFVVSSEELLPVSGTELSDEASTDETTEDSELSVVSEEFVVESLDDVISGELDVGVEKSGTWTFFPLPHAAMDVVITASSTDLTITVFAENISNPRGGCLLFASQTCDTACKPNSFERLTIPASFHSH